MLPSTSAPIAFPAVRITDRSSTFEDDLHGQPGVRAPEQDRVRPLAWSDLGAACRILAQMLRPPATKRRLPASNSSNASAGFGPRSQP